MIFYCKHSREVAKVYRAYTHAIEARDMTLMIATTMTRVAINALRKNGITSVKKRIVMIQEISKQVARQ